MSITESPAVKPLVVGVGGTFRERSTTDCALRISLKAAAEAGTRMMFFGGGFLAKLPMYRPESCERTAEQRQLIEAVRLADGLIVASPGYHGGVSGLVKNALDLLEDLREDNRSYLEGRAVGCIITGQGWQTTGVALTALRSIVHALRGWPTPLGATLNTADNIFDAEGNCTDDRSVVQLTTVGHQVAEFAFRHLR